MNKISKEELESRFGLYGDKALKNQTSDEEILKAVKNGDMSVRSIVDQNEKLLLSILDHDSDAYLRFREESFTYKICEKIILSSNLFGGFIPRRFQTRDLCIKAINKFAHVIDRIYAPTEEMYILAIKRNTTMFPDIPNPTKEMCLQAFECDKDMFQYIPYEFTTQEMIEEAIKYNPDNIQYVKRPDMKDYSLAFNLDSDTIRFAIEYYAKEPDWLIALKKTPSLLIYAKHPTYPMVLEASKGFFDKEYFKRLPIEFETDEVKTNIINNDGLNTRWLKNPTKKDWLLALNNTFECAPSGLFKYFPEEYKTEELCLKAVINYPNNLQYTYGYQTQEMCIKALRRTESVYPFVNKNLFKSDRTLELTLEDIRKRFGAKEIKIIEVK